MIRSFLNLTVSIFSTEFTSTEGEVEPQHPTGTVLHMYICNGYSRILLFLCLACEEELKSPHFWQA